MKEAPRPVDKAWQKQKVESHIDIQKFTGFWHGTYFRDGMSQKPKEKQEKPPAVLHDNTPTE